MAGGGIFMLIVFVLSVTILLIWIGKGRGSLSWKCKFTCCYFTLTIVPALAASYLGSMGFYSILMENLSFILCLFIFLSGFLIPIIANKRIEGD